MKLLGSGADPDHGRVFMMWQDEGYEFRQNTLLYVGATIPMHEHHYAHDYLVGPGVYALTVERPDGSVEEREVQGGYVGHVPALHKHHFKLTEWGGAPGFVRCYWLEGTARG